MQRLITSQPIENAIKNNNVVQFDVLSQIEDPKPAKTYEYSFETCLKHSNATQNIYFSNYVEWQGTVRERWFFDCIDPNMLSAEGVFVTKEAHQFYLKEGFPFSTIVCRLNSFRLQRCGFRLLFRFYCDDILISYGYQHVVFMGLNKRIVRLPSEVKEKVEAFSLPCDQDILGV